MKQKLQNYLRELLSLVKIAPMEMVVSIGFFVWYVMAEMAVGLVFGTTDIITFICALIVIWSANNIFKRGIWRFVYYLSPLLIYPIYHVSNLPSLGVFLVFTALLFANGWSHNNGNYAEKAFSIVRSLLFSLTITIMIYIVVILIYGTALQVFKIDDHGFNLYEYIFMFCFFVIYPIFFLYIEELNLELTLKDNSTLKFCVKYILDPAIIIYTCLLYLLAAGVVINWELPEGKVALMVISFNMTILFAHIVHTKLLVSSKFNRIFYKNYSYISLPMLVLFWLSVAERIQEYGFTEMRVLLILAGVVMTFYNIMGFCSKSNRFQYINYLTIVLFGLATFIPGITAKDIASYMPEVSRDSSRDVASGPKNFYISSLGSIDVTGMKRLVNINHGYFDNETGLYVATINAKDTTKVQIDLRLILEKKLQSREIRYIQDTVFDQDFYHIEISPDTVYILDHASITVIEGERRSYEVDYADIEYVLTR